MDIQHFRVKLFATPDSHPRLSDAIPVFHRWIQNKTLPEMMIDVSDYEHVPSGPGIILVCHEAIYSLDKLGLVYNRRTALNGSVEDRLQQAVKSVESAAELLEKESEFSGKLRFNRNAWEVAVNDRMLAPNTEATWKSLEPVIRRVFDKIIGAGKYTLQHHADPRELFRVTVAP
jgi:hypothetical protein